MISTTLNEFTNGINQPDAFEMTQEQLNAKLDENFKGHGAAITTWLESTIGGRHTSLLTT